MINNFEWINLLPIAATICDSETLTILSSNKIFDGMVGGGNVKGKKLTDFLLDGRGAMLIQNSIVKLKIAGNTFKPVILDSSEVTAEGQSFIINTYADAARISYNGLKLSIFMDDDDKMDKLTSIFNKEYGCSVLNDIIRHDNDIATICYFDIKGLEKVNNDFGQLTGDEYILNVVSIIKASIRQSDVFFRLNGDKFLLIFPKCRNEIVETIIATVILKLEQLNKTSRKRYRTSINYGIVELHPSKFENAEAAISAAVSVAEDMKKV